MPALKKKTCIEYHSQPIIITPKMTRNNNFAATDIKLKYPHLSPESLNLFSTLNSSSSGISSLYGLILAKFIPKNLKSLCLLAKFLSNPKLSDAYDYCHEEYNYYNKGTLHGISTNVSYTCALKGRNNYYLKMPSIINIGKLLSLDFNITSTFSDQHLLSTTANKQILSFINKAVSLTSLFGAMKKEIEELKNKTPSVIDFSHDIGGKDGLIIKTSCSSDHLINLLSAVIELFELKFTELQEGLEEKVKLCTSSSSIDYSKFKLEDFTGLKNNKLNEGQSYIYIATDDQNQSGFIGVKVGNSYSNPARLCLVKDIRSALCFAMSDYKLCGIDAIAHEKLFKDIHAIEVQQRLKMSKSQKEYKTPQVQQFALSLDAYNLTDDLSQIIPPSAPASESVAKRSKI